jgi:hypothetical protein
MIVPWLSDCINFQRGLIFHGLCVIIILHFIKVFKFNYMYTNKGQHSMAQLHYKIPKINDDHLVLCGMFCRSLFVLLLFIFWSLCCLSFCLLVIVLFILLSFGHCVVYHSVFWSLCCLSCLFVIVLSILLSFGHCVFYPSVFWSLCCLSFCLLVIVLSILLSFGHCVVYPSSNYGFWLLLCYPQTLLTHHSEWVIVVECRASKFLISYFYPDFDNACFILDQHA